jgi:hypothetical protein
MVPIGMPTDLKKMSTKHNKYVVNQKHKNFDDVSSGNFLVESKWFFFYKIRFVSSCDRVFVSTLAILYGS